MWYHLAILEAPKVAMSQEVPELYLESSLSNQERLFTRGLLTWMANPAETGKVEDFPVGFH